MIIAHIEAEDRRIELRIRVGAGGATQSRPWPKQWLEDASRGEKTGASLQRQVAYVGHAVIADHAHLPFEGAGDDS